MNIVCMNKESVTSTSPHIPSFTTIALTHVPLRLSVFLAPFRASDFPKQHPFSNALLPTEPKEISYERETRTDPFQPPGNLDEILHHLRTLWSLQRSIFHVIGTKRCLVSFGLDFFLVIKYGNQE